jgi:nickel superoxide dismutase
VYIGSPLTLAGPSVSTPPPGPAGDTVGGTVALPVGGVAVPGVAVVQAANSTIARIAIALRILILPDVSRNIDAGRPDIPTGRSQIAGRRASRGLGAPRRRGAQWQDRDNTKRKECCCMLSRLTRALAPRHTVHAHCDIPCGVYDPQQARIEAESCYKIIAKYHESSDDLFKARCIVVKEERAELAKHHIDVMWHDYFKPEHVKKFADLHDVCWKAAKQASTVKRSLDIAEAEKLLALIDRIDHMWRETGGPAATRMQPMQPMS